MSEGLKRFNVLKTSRKADRASLITDDVDNQDVDLTSSSTPTNHYGAVDGGKQPKKSGEKSESGPGILPPKPATQLRSSDTNFYVC